MTPRNMHAGVFEQEGMLLIKEVSVPEVVKPDDVLLRVEACGVCGTDLRILAVPPTVRARKGVVLGHEHIGRVEEVGAGVSQFRPGDRVAVIPDVPCGACSQCMEGRPNLCLNPCCIGGDLDGGFAPYALAPSKALCRISPDLPAEEGAFIELLSCVLSGVKKAALLPGEDVVIFGAGPAGLVYLKALKAAGAGQVIMVEISPWRIEFARNAGADRVINPQEVDLGEEVRSVTDGGAHVVIDAVGSQLPAAMAVARRGARIIVFGEDQRAQCTIRPQEIQGKELQILGSFIGINVFPKAARLLESGRLRLGGLITHRLSLAELPAGIAELTTGRGAKGVCFPWD